MWALLWNVAVDIENKIDKHLKNLEQLFIKLGV